jgi:hypothetical protein
VAGKLEQIVVTEARAKNTAKAVDADAHIARSVSEYGNLSNAARYCILRYGSLSYQLRGSGLQAHHLIPQRFAKIFEQKVRDMLSVAVTPGEHDIFTQAWRDAIPYGRGTARATEEQVLNAAKRIYTKYPAILKSLGLDH